MNPPPHPDGDYPDGDLHHDDLGQGDNH
jgi:hypothetical protein